MEVTDREGRAHQLDAAEGRVLMLQLRPMKVGVIGLCNGNAACGTCHVYVDPGQQDRLPPPEEEEMEMLEKFERQGIRRPTSRLACQIEPTGSLSDLRVTVAPKNARQG